MQKNPPTVFRSEATANESFNGKSGGGVFQIFPKRSIGGEGGGASVRVWEGGGDVGAVPPARGWDYTFLSDRLVQYAPSTIISSKRRFKPIHRRGSVCNNPSFHPMTQGAGFSRCSNRGPGMRDTPNLTVLSREITYCESKISTGTAEANNDAHQSKVDQTAQKCFE